MFAFSDAAIYLWKVSKTAKFMDRHREFLNLNLSSQLFMPVEIRHTYQEVVALPRWRCHRAGAQS